MRRVTDQQVRKLMDEINQERTIEQAALKAGMHRETARKYLNSNVMPSTMNQPRTWKTRPDAFDAQKDRIAELLSEHPQIEGRTLLRLLDAEFPGQFDESQLRTLHRRIERWRVSQDDTALAMLAQRHVPGEAGQTDFTSTSELQITIAGKLFAHLLGVFVLPFSNWMWVTVCLSESMLAIRNTVQRALFQLGHVPKFHQTDNSTAATHQIAKEDIVRSAKRTFNREYLALMNHFGMTPRTIKVGESHQNGDVEAGNGACKRAIEQALILRGNRDFASQREYQQFLDELNRARNKGRGIRVAQEINAMPPLAVNKLVEFIEERVTVSTWSTISIRKNCYSVPPRLIGQQLRVRLFEDHIEAYFGDHCELHCERIRGEGKRSINYRHVVWSLLRNPGGFARYVYRQEMFPTQNFRRAFDAIDASKQEVARDREYLRILHLAASTMESDVDAALSLLMEQSEPITYERVKELADSRRRPSVPTLEPMKPELSEYDALIAAVCA